MCDSVYGQTRRGIDQQCLKTTNFECAHFLYLLLKKKRRNEQQPVSEANHTYRSSTCARHKYAPCDLLKKNWLEYLLATGIVRALVCTQILYLCGSVYIGSKFHWLLAWFLHARLCLTSLPCYTCWGLSVSIVLFFVDIDCACILELACTQKCSHTSLSAACVCTYIYILFRFVLRNRWASAYDSYFIVYNNKIAISKRQIVLPTENKQPENKHKIIIPT